MGCLEKSGSEIHSSNRNNQVNPGNPQDLYLVGGWPLPLWKMMEWKSVGMMKFPIWWENKIPWFQTTNQIIALLIPLLIPSLTIIDHQPANHPIISLSPASRCSLSHRHRRHWRGTCRPTSRRPILHRTTSVFHVSVNMAGINWKLNVFQTIWMYNGCINHL